MNLKQFAVGVAITACLASLSHAETITIDITADTLSLIPAHILACKPAGYKKLESQAKGFGVAVDMRTFRLTGSSSSVFAKYLWWSVDVTDINGRADVFPPGKPAVLNVMTQQSPVSACF